MRKVKGSASFLLDDDFFSSWILDQVKITLSKQMPSFLLMMSSIAKQKQ